MKQLGQRDRGTFHTTGHHVQCVQWGKEEGECLDWWHLPSQVTVLAFGLGYIPHPPLSAAHINSAQALPIFYPFADSVQHIWVKLISQGSFFSSEHIWLWCHCWPLALHHRSRILNYCYVLFCCSKTCLYPAPATFATPLTSVISSQLFIGPSAFKAISTICPDAVHFYWPSHHKLCQFLLPTPPAESIRVPWWAEIPLPCLASSFSS